MTNSRSGSHHKFALLVVSLFLLALFLGIASVTIILFSKGSESTETNHRGDEGSNEIRYHKYLFVLSNDEEGSSYSRKIESTKEINDFSLYEVEHGVRVYPFSQRSESLKEYICECDLSKLEEFLVTSEGFSRRSSTMSHTRRSRIHSTSQFGMILVSAVGMLMMLIKTNVIKLRIFAQSEIEADRITAEKITSRILSEVDDFDENIEDQLENMEDIEDLMGQIIEEDEELKEKFQSLEEQIRALVKCNEDGGGHQIFDNMIDHGPDDNIYYFEDCAGICEGNNAILSCLKFSDWEGESILFEKEVWKVALGNECRNLYDVGVIEPTVECIPYHGKQNIDLFLNQKGYSHPKDVGENELGQLLLDFDKHCKFELRASSCYSLAKNVNT